jgi:hypothetical protein
LNRAISCGLSVLPDKHPRLPERNNRRPTEAERHRFLELEKRRNARADELGIDATLIASRATLLDLARAWNEHAGGLMNWQCELLGGGDR